MIDAGSGSDLASGDCVWILFDNSDFHLRNITSTSINVGGMDEIRMGDGKHITNVEFSYLLFSWPQLLFSRLITGDDVAIGGQNIDTMYGGKLS